MLQKISLCLKEESVPSMPATYTSVPHEGMLQDILRDAMDRWPMENAEEI